MVVSDSTGGVAELAGAVPEPDWEPGTDPVGYWKPLLEAGCVGAAVVLGPEDDAEAADEEGPAELGPADETGYEVETAPGLVSDGMGEGP
jgi:hypothetical protein